MSRPRLYMKDFHAALRPLDYAFINYYAAKYGLNKQDVLRRIVQAFVDKDKSLDVGELKKWVTANAVPEEEDPDLREELKKQLKVFVEDRKAAEADTRTM